MYCHSCVSHIAVISDSPACMSCVEKPPLSRHWTILEATRVSKFQSSGSGFLFMAGCAAYCDPIFQHKPLRQLVAHIHKALQLPYTEQLHALQLKVCIISCSCRPYLQHPLHSARARSAGDCSATVSVEYLGHVQDSPHRDVLWQCDL